MAASMLLVTISEIDARSVPAAREWTRLLDHRGVPVTLAVRPETDPSRRIGWDRADLAWLRARTEGADELALDDSPTTPGERSTELAARVRAALGALRDDGLEPTGISVAGPRLDAGRRHVLRACGMAYVADRRRVERTPDRWLDAPALRYVPDGLLSLTDGGRNRLCDAALRLLTWRGGAVRIDLHPDGALDRRARVRSMHAIDTVLATGASPHTIADALGLDTATGGQATGRPRLRVVA